jgi:hypothetical protein
LREDIHKRRPITEGVRASDIKANIGPLPPHPLREALKLDVNKVGRELINALRCKLTLLGRMLVACSLSTDQVEETKRHLERGVIVSVESTQRPIIDMLHVRVVIDAHEGWVITTGAIPLSVERPEVFNVGYPTVCGARMGTL